MQASFIRLPRAQLYDRTLMEVTETGKDASHSSKHEQKLKVRTAQEAVGGPIRNKNKNKNKIKRCKKKGGALKTKHKKF